jgi:quercetin dioxygenase-like cupin family protein
MKKLTLVLICGLILFAAANIGIAQDPIEVSPEHYSVLFENERVRVLEVRYQPGDVSEFHRHPENLVIAISESAARAINEDGTSRDYVFEAGDVMWRDVQEHRGSNSSDEEMHIVMVEFKDNDRE